VTVYAEGPGESPGFLLWRVTLRWQRLITEALRPLGLTHVQFVLLASAWWLSQHGQTPSQLAVAAHAGTNVKMTSEVLRKLEDRGLVIQHTDANDRRAKAITVTAEGLSLAARAVRVVEKVDVDFFGTAPPGLLPALQVLAELGQQPQIEESQS
jgi:DNA-binding MarR family transcriptional regulator